MQVGVVGTGYVGLVSAACLADTGHKVVAYDIDSQRVDAIVHGQIPMYEPGLQDIVARNIQRSTLSVTDNFDDMAQAAQIIMIAVGTPTNTATGEADMQYVIAAARTIGKTITTNCVVVNKSTVPVGSCRMVQNIIREELQARNIQITCEVASNPEFLKEGNAVEDFVRPDRIIIGCQSDFAETLLRELYVPFCRNHEKILRMDPESAELTKYAANCLLATKISFMNQLVGMADAVGANIESVRQGMGSDPRIGYHFIYPGIGYGGSCFSKDVRALMASMRQKHVPAELLDAVERINERQKEHLFNKICHYYHGNIRGKTFAIWGLAFKPETDDIREAPSLVILTKLLAKGASVVAYDPKAIPNTQKKLGSLSGLRYGQSASDCIEQCDALIICTEWREFRSPNWQSLAIYLRDKVIFDGRNMFLNIDFTEKKLHYIPIGVPTTSANT